MPAKHRRSDNNSATGSLVIASIAARPGLFARFFFALAALALLSSCGSGAVSGPPATGSATLTISPSTATLYADTPATFFITGGTGTYVLTSSDQLALPLSGIFQANQVTVVPGAVAADTPVTLSVRDNGSATPITASVTVKARTLSNVLTVTPSASQSAACGTAVCAGGDAEVRVQLTQTSLPLANRTVRFDVVSGEFRIITSAPGETEALGLTATAVSDASGVARIRIRVLTDANSQTALLQVTDVATGFVQRTSFAIAPSSNAPLNAQPATLNFKGSTANTCATGLSADVIVFGGRPPYQISQPGSFVVSPTVIPNSGGRFTVTANGQCSPGSAIAVVDAAGSSVTVSAINALSDQIIVITPPVTTNPPFAVFPAVVTLTSCNSIGSVGLSGGSGAYFGSVNDASLTITFPGSGAVASIQRTSDPLIAPPSAGPDISIDAVFSDGTASKTVRVSLKGDAATAVCP